MADHNSETPVPVELGPSPVTDFPHQTDDDNESSSSFTLEELQNASPPALLPATSPSFRKRRRRRLPRFLRRSVQVRAKAQSLHSDQTSIPFGLYVASKFETRLSRYIATERPFRSVAT
ncbi:hypothetical protein F2Q69_00019229 [Brassica cretica]|uniref:Uncharacterized protein n=1 Tax=Brassica cretica TaxID=69181 RepID=A0A8S9QBA5_BRACR|nr:hypothetical protein F2Q69_00019229 [Brassica cretica]